mgnify:CR=1 FL=1
MVRPFGAEVFPKIGVKDAIDLHNSGISDDEYTYAMMAHFDYVVADARTKRALFAVEYHGASHFTCEPAIMRDRKKSALCNALRFDVVRITKFDLIQDSSGRTQLQTLVECWFAGRQLQTSGNAPVRRQPVRAYEAHSTGPTSASVANRARG